MEEPDVKIFMDMTNKALSHLGGQRWWWNAVTWSPNIHAWKCPSADGVDMPQKSKFRPAQEDALVIVGLEDSFVALQLIPMSSSIRECNWLIINLWGAEGFFSLFFYTVFGLLLGFWHHWNRSKTELSARFFYGYSAGLSALYFFGIIRKPVPKPKQNKRKSILFQLS
jgi:hypothetical protein